MNQWLFYLLYSQHLWNLIAVPYPELLWSRYSSLGSQTQTPKLSKVLISGVSFHHRSLSQSHKSNVLSYSECKIANIFQGFTPERHWGRLTVPPRLTNCTTFFSSLSLLKNRHPQKIAGYSTDEHKITITCIFTFFIKSAILIQTKILEKQYRKCNF